MCFRGRFPEHWKPPEELYKRNNSVPSFPPHLVGVSEGGTTSASDFSRNREGESALFSPSLPCLSYQRGERQKFKKHHSCRRLNATLTSAHSGTGCKQKKACAGNNKEKRTPPFLSHTHSHRALFPPSQTYITYYTQIHISIERGYTEREL